MDLYGSPVIQLGDESLAVTSLFLCNDSCFKTKQFHRIITGVACFVWTENDWSSKNQSFWGGHNQWNRLESIPKPGWSCHSNPSYRPTHSNTKGELSRQCLRLPQRSKKFPSHAICSAESSRDTRAWSWHEVASIKITFQELYWLDTNNSPPSTLGSGCHAACPAHPVQVQLGQSDPTCRDPNCGETRRTTRNNQNVPIWSSGTWPLHAFANNTRWQNHLHFLHWSNMS